MIYSDRKRPVLYARGFSLVEMVLVVALLLITTLVAVPGYNSYIDNERARTATSGLSTAFAQARAEALRRREVVVVCGSNAVGAACNNSTNWSGGWLVVDGDGVVLGSWPAPRGGSAIDASAATVTFRSSGETTAAVNVEVSVSGQSRCVRVLVSGQSHSDTGGC